MSRTDDIDDLPPGLREIAAAVLAGDVAAACEALHPRIDACKHAGWILHRLPRDHWSAKTGEAWDRVAEGRRPDSPLLLALVLVALQPSPPADETRLLDWLVDRAPAVDPEAALDELIVLAALCDPRTSPEVLRLRPFVPAWIFDLARYGGCHADYFAGAEPVDLAEAIAGAHASSWRLAYMTARAILRAGDANGRPPHAELAWFEEASRRAAVDPVDALAARMHRGLVYRWGTYEGQNEDAWYVTPHLLECERAQAYLAAGRFEAALAVADALLGGPPPADLQHPLRFILPNLVAGLRARALAGCVRLDEADDAYARAIELAAPARPPARGRVTLDSLSADNLRLERALLWARTGRLDEVGAALSQSLAGTPLLMRRFLEDPACEALVDVVPGLRDELTAAYDRLVPHFAEYAGQHINYRVQARLGEYKASAQACRELATRLNAWRPDDGARAIVHRWTAAALDGWMKGVYLDWEVAPELTALTRVVSVMLGPTRGSALVTSVAAEIGHPDRP